MFASLCSDRKRPDFHFVCPPLSSQPPTTYKKKKTKKQSKLLIKNRKTIIFIKSVIVSLEMDMFIRMSDRTLGSVDAIAKNSQNENRIDDAVKLKRNFMSDNIIANV